MAGHGQFQAAAERGAVNGHHHRLASSLRSAAAAPANPSRRARLPEVILPNSLMSAPAMNVRPPPMSTAALTLSSLSICSIASRNAFGHAGAERVDRRIVDGDDGDVVVFCELYQVAHVMDSLFALEFHAVFAETHPQRQSPAEAMRSR